MAIFINNINIQNFIGGIIISIIFLIIGIFSFLHKPIYVKQSTLTITSVNVRYVNKGNSNTTSASVGGVTVSHNNRNNIEYEITGTVPECGTKVLSVSSNKQNSITPPKIGDILTVYIKDGNICDYAAFEIDDYTFTSIILILISSLIMISTYYNYLAMIK